jgi:predicted SAM-dependent methyltransferase
MDEREPLILNLGSGKRPMADAINMDCNPENPDVSIVGNIEERLPFDDNTFDVVYAQHILEHVHNLPYVLSEVHRVCRNGGRVKIEAPHWTNPAFYDDPSHLKPFTEETIPFICDEKNYGCLKVRGRFNLIRSIVIGEPWSREKPTCVVAEMEVIK